ncbi:MAG: 50S ribosomal protein L4 [Alphaproteobacteria bacterium]|nr:50S ribosomal protein L4 [Alphaproteobacteria bacterium]MBO7641689.1 50S ribosomal protein L4 [Alphaproteobacteria bacterium]
MKLQVIKLDGTKSGDIVLNDSVFGIEPKTESLADVVRWQLARRQAGTHAVKGRSDVSRTSKKLYRQKGTGRARHGARTANIFVGGGVVFGPTPRSHDFKINKKVRELALRSMLSLKAKENNLVICEDLNLATNKTKDLSAILGKLDLKSALFVDFGNFDNFKQACSNLYRIDVLPTIGLNVYDGLSHEKIVLTRSAVENIQERLG